MIAEEKDTMIRCLPQFPAYVLHLSRVITMEEGMNSELTRTEMRMIIEHIKYDETFSL